MYLPGYLISVPLCLKYLLFACALAQTDSSVTYDLVDKFYIIYLGMVTEWWLREMLFEGKCAIVIA